MIEKRLLCPERVRRVPEHFSWLDHRLVRDNHLQHCTPSALALYLFLVIVCDGQGLSYYSDRSIARHLKMEPQALEALRSQLCQAGLIAYQKPLYQVLDLSPEKGGSRQGAPLSIKELFKRALEENQ